MRNPALGRALKYLFYFCLLIAGAATFYLVTQSGVRELNSAMPFVAKIGALLIALIFYPIFYLGLKLKAPLATDVLAKDPRSPVLYLRGFGHDGDALLRRWFQQSASSVGLGTDKGVTAEERLAHVLRPIGPMVAIGRPRERLPTLGAARMYVHDDHWRSVVQDLTAEAALTVLRLGDTPGLWWEIEHVLTTVPPERILFYLAQAKDRDAQKGFAVFKERASTMVPHEIPENYHDATFLGFDRHWWPIFFRAESRLLFDARAPVLLLSAGSADPGGVIEKDENALATIFENLGPVVAICGVNATPPADANAWMHLTDEAVGALLKNPDWRAATVVMRAEPDGGFALRLQRVAEHADPQKVVIYVPPFDANNRRSAIPSIEESIEAATRCKISGQLERAAYLAFDRGWGARVVNRFRLSHGGWLTVWRKRTRASHRVSSAVLTPIFERYGRRAPGLGARRCTWALIALSGFLTVVGSIYGLGGLSQEDTRPRLTREHDIQTNWQGLVWGLPQDQVRTHYPYLGRPLNETANLQIVSAGETLTIGSEELPMHFLFAKGRMVGAVLSTEMQAQKRAPKILAELVSLYGQPQSQPGRFEWTRGDVVVRLEEPSSSTGPKARLWASFVYLPLAKGQRPGD